MAHLCVTRLSLPPGLGVGRTNSSASSLFLRTCSLLKCRVESTETRDDDDQGQGGQIGDMGGNVACFAAFQHDIAEKAHVMRERVEKGNPPERGGHVLEREHHSREHDHRET